MVFPNTVLKSVKEAIKTSGRLPDSTSYAIFELDSDGGQANVRPPVVEITTVDTLRSTSLNTDFVGHSTDDSGNHIGRLYRAGFEMPIQIDVVTAEGDAYDPKKIGNDVRMALYQYEDRQEATSLPNPDSDGTLGDVTKFQMSDGTTDNDLAMTPALRGWRQGATVWFEEVIDTAVEYGEKEYVKTVDAPEPGEGVDGTEITVVFDVTPSQTSEADQHT